MEATTITYQSIRDLALFQEQYDRLTLEIQQVRVQLDSSPALADDDPNQEKREEWRSWLSSSTTRAFRLPNCPSEFFFFHSLYIKPN